MTWKRTGELSTITGSGLAWVEGRGSLAQRSAIGERGSWLRAWASLRVGLWGWGGCGHRETSGPEQRAPGGEDPGVRALRVGRARLMVPVKPQ